MQVCDSTHDPSSAPGLKKPTPMNLAWNICCLNVTPRWCTQVPYKTHRLLMENIILQQSCWIVSLQDMICFASLLH